MSVVASFVAGISSGALCVYVIQDSVSIRRSNQGDRLEYAILGAKARPVRVFFLILYESRKKSPKHSTTTEIGTVRRRYDSNVRGTVLESIFTLVSSIRFIHFLLHTDSKVNINTVIIIITIINLDIYI